MMKKYKVSIWRAGYFFGQIGSLCALGMMIFGMYAIIRSKQPVILVVLGLGCLFAAVVLFYLAFFYLNRLKLYVDDENVTYQLPDKKITFKIKDIYKIEKDFSYAGVGYYVFFYDEKRKKRHIKFQEDVENSEALIEYLQKKSGVKMRWEGTVDVKNEKRPFIKVLKTAWNIFIVVFIIGATVVYPIVAHLNREKEQKLHLPERSLWP